MPNAADLEALKAKLADAASAKSPLTYSQLVPLQASLDAADGSRYHDDGSLPDTDNAALIDECYGEREKGKRATTTMTSQKGSKRRWFFFRRPLDPSNRRGIGL